MFKDTYQCFLTLGSFYALKAEDGFTLIRFLSLIYQFLLLNPITAHRLRSKAGEVITGSVLKIREESERRPDSFKYVETEEIIEAISSDVITEVELVKGMCLSKRTIDEILSIYMWMEDSRGEELANARIALYSACEKVCNCGLGLTCWNGVHFVFSSA